VVIPTVRFENYKKGISKEGLRANLDRIEEQRSDAHLQALAYKNVVTRLYNRRSAPDTLR
ncbi:hypothetical protein BHE74_00020791, partial [Ensete ventricosum]